MKTIFLLIMFCYSSSVFAQKVFNNNDSYYLFDTLRVAASSTTRWYVAKHDKYKIYTLECSCLNGDGNPTFYVDNDNKGELIDKSTFKKLKKINLSTLIQQSKKFLDEDKKNGRNRFFFIEPQGKEYIIYNMNVWNSATKIVSGPDVFSLQPDTSAFAVKGLQNVNLDEISKYMGKAIITSGKVLSTKVKDDQSVLIKVGDAFTKQEVCILINSENTKNFDMPAQFFKRKKVKVTGIVINYEGKPTVSISNQNQIQSTY